MPANVELKTRAADIRHQRELEKALGLRGRVRKVRTLYRSGRTRIHLDEVEGLGSFIELEVVLLPGEGVKEGTQEAPQGLGFEPGEGAVPRNSSSEWTLKKT